MQNDNYYRRLIVQYYQADTLYLKKKYKNSFEAIYRILEKQEKDILELQELVLNIIDEKKEFEIIRLFSNQKNPEGSYRAFKRNLFNVDTSREINKRLYQTAMCIMDKLKTRGKKWKQQRWVF